MRRNKWRVLIIISTPAMGGIGNQVLSFLQRYDRSRFIVDIACGISTEGSLRYKYLATGTRLILCRWSRYIIPCVWCLLWLLHREGYDVVHSHIEIGGDEAFIGRCDTHPVFRGKNIYPVVLQHIVRYAATKNKHRCFITTAPTLVASIRGIEKAGFSFVGRLRRFRLLGKLFNNHWISSKRI